MQELMDGMPCLIAFAHSQDSVLVIPKLGESVSQRAGLGGQVPARDVFSDLLDGESLVHLDQFASLK